ncbi:MAG: hypothetical protein LBF58_10460, partial [Deltaproteobacteria bacterium]|nr:hypothetical protein [Deltaproteobacteria bacterium]
LKFRFPPEIVSQIEKCQWWHWNHELLKERLNDFNDVVAFANATAIKRFVIVSPKVKIVWL